MRMTFAMLSLLSNHQISLATYSIALTICMETKHVYHAGITVL